jgi:hypothetical protein
MERTGLLWFVILMLWVNVIVGTFADTDRSEQIKALEEKVKHLEELEERMQSLEGGK